MNEYLEVISTFYEFKNIILDLFTEKMARKFDTCFQKFREALEKKATEQALDNAQQSEGEPPKDKVKCFETIREETVHDLSALIDSKLTLALEKFLNRDDIAKKIKYIVDKQFQEDLTWPTTEANQEADNEFKAELDALCLDLEERVQAKESQLNDVKEKLKNLLNKNKSNQVILLKQYRNFTEGFKD